MAIFLAEASPRFCSCFAEYFGAGSFGCVSWALLRPALIHRHRLPGKFRLKPLPVAHDLDFLQPRPHGHKPNNWLSAALAAASGRTLPFNLQFCARPFPLQLCHQTPRHHQQHSLSLRNKNSYAEAKLAFQTGPVYIAFLLFNPFTLLTTTAWGEFDTLIALLCVSSFYFLSQGKAVASSVLLSLSFVLKPISLPLLGLPLSVFNP